MKREYVMKKFIIGGLVTLSFICLFGCGAKEGASTSEGSAFLEVSIVDTSTTSSTAPEDFSDVSAGDEEYETPASASISSETEDDEIIAGIEAYKIVMNDVSAEDENHKVLAYVELPRFIGEADSVDEVNAMLQKIDDDYCKEYEKDAKEWLATMKDYPEKEEFQDNTIHAPRVFWDADGNISVGMISGWYMGGVYNCNYSAINYNHITKKFVTIEEVLGISRQEVDELILSQIGDKWDGVDLEALNNIEAYDFCFDEKYVYVGFDSYTFSEWADYYQIIVIPR